MAEWLVTDIPSLILGLLLLILVILAVRKLMKDRQEGKTSCSGTCGGCPMNGQCHHKK